MIKLGVARLPEVQRDNTDRNRTSPFAFTGQKFEFRAVGSSASIAFPVALLNSAVADAIGEITDALRETMKKTKSVDEAVLKVVREVFKETRARSLRGQQLLRGVGYGSEEAGPPESSSHPRSAQADGVQAVPRAAHQARSAHQGGARVPLPRPRRALREGHAHRASYAARDRRHDRDARLPTDISDSWRSLRRNRRPPESP